jgi:predicted DNA-binding ribbon-helix-helix protein
MSETRDGVIKRSIVIAGHRTSVSIEEAFWDRLKIVALRDGISVAGLIARIDSKRGRQNLSSAIRLHVLADALASSDQGSDVQGLAAGGVITSG